jgi:hypothetical protein
MELIERAKAIIMKPKDIWGEIKEEQITIKDLYTSYAAILAAIPPVARLIGMSIIGMSFMGFRYRVPFGSAITYAVMHYILSLVGLYIVGMVTNALAPSFGSQKNMLNAIKVAIFSSTPNWVAGILLIIPALSPIAMLLSLYSLYLFYLGLPVLMETPKEKTLGYVIVVIILSIIVFFLTTSIAGLFIPSRGMVMP